MNFENKKTVRFLVFFGKAIKITFMFTLKLYKQSFCDKVKALWFKVFHKINNLFGLILKLRGMTYYGTGAPILYPKLYKTNPYLII